MTDTRLLVWSSLGTYVVLSTLLLGHPFRPLTLLAFNSDRISFDLVWLPTILGVIASIVVLPAEWIETCGIVRDSD